MTHEQYVADDFRMTMAYITLAKKALSKAYVLIGSRVWEDHAPALKDLEERVDRVLDKALKLTDEKVRKAFASCEKDGEEWEDWDAFFIGYEDKALELVESAMLALYEEF